MAVLIGTRFNDNLVSPNAFDEDTLLGLEGNDRLEARGANDRLDGGLGNDRLEGGDQTDTAVFAFRRADYEIFRFDRTSPQEMVIRGREGVDTTLSIERLEFASDSGIGGPRNTVDADNIPLFPSLSYIASHRDLINAFGANEQSGWNHFRDNGAQEGRTITFDPYGYLAENRDVFAAFGANSVDAARHFISNGVNEGRRTGVFDPLDYVASYRDLILAFRGVQPDQALVETGLRHFIEHGRAEGRPRDQFDAEQYLENYADLRAAFGDDTNAAALHFIRLGFGEGRSDDPI